MERHFFSPLYPNANICAFLGDLLVFLLHRREQEQNYYSANQLFAQVFIAAIAKKCKKSRQNRPKLHKKRFETRHKVTSLGLEPESMSNCTKIAIFLGIYESYPYGIYIEYHGRRCVAICAEVNQLIPNTFLEVLDNQDIFYVVRPL